MKIIHFRAANAQIIREHLLTTEVFLIFSIGVKQMVGVRSKSWSDIQIGYMALGFLDDVIYEVVDVLCMSLSSYVRTDEEQTSIRTVRMDNVGAPAAQILLGIDTNYLPQADGTLFKYSNLCED